MVTAWLKEEDNVIKTSGKPSWSSLIKSLEEHGHNGIIARIKEHFQCSSGSNGASGYSAQVEGAGNSSQASPIQEEGADDVLAKGHERIQSDFWPFTSSKPVHKVAKDRGDHQVKLKLGDGEELTQVKPDSTSGPPSSALKFYPMQAKRHGVALIINNKIFKAHSVRDGTDRDVYNLTETWLFLGYHVVVLDNYEADRMLKTFANIDKLLASVKDVAHDSFTCCILSHGVLGGVISSDSKPVTHSDIMKALSSSETLRGKPKMLFIQTCQGGDHGPQLLEDRLKSDDGQISQYTDFYLSCAAVDGDKAYRDIYRGTWYIYELSRTLCEYGKVMCLDEVQKKVNERVVSNSDYVFQNKHLQQPCGKDLLRRKVFFFHE